MELSPRVYVMWAVLTVSPLDFLVSCGDSNHGIGSPVHHFGCFLSLTALMIQFVWNDCKDLLPIRIVDQQFYPCWFFATLASVAMKSQTPIRARTGGVKVSKPVWPALPRKWLIRVDHPLKAAKQRLVIPSLACTLFKIFHSSLLIPITNHLVRSTVFAFLTFFSPFLWPSSILFWHNIIGFNLLW